MKIYIVTTQSEYELSVETVKHGAYASYISARNKWRNIVQDFMTTHKFEIDKYQNEESYPDEESGHLYMQTDYGNGYFICKYGAEEHRETHQICIDEYELEN